MSNPSFISFSGVSKSYDGAQYVVQYMIGRVAFQFGFRFEHHPVPKNRQSYGLHVVGNYVVAVIHGSPRLGSHQKT